MAWKKFLAILSATLIINFPVIADNHQDEVTEVPLANLESQADYNFELVDLELVIALDSSYSMNQQDINENLEAYARTFESNEFGNALRSGQYGRIGLSIISWNRSTNLALDWVIVDESNRFEIAERIRNVDLGSRGITLPGQGLLNIALFMADNDRFFEPTRRIILFSTDGMPSHFNALDRDNLFDLAQRISTQLKVTINMIIMPNYRFG